MHSCSSVDEVEFGWCGGVDGLIFRVPIAFVGGIEAGVRSFSGGSREPWRRGPWRGLANVPRLTL